MYAVISAFSKSFDDLGLIYKIPIEFTNSIKVWQILEIPFKSSTEIWVILTIKKSITTNFDDSKIKEIISIKNTTIFLSGYRLKLLWWIASNYFTAIHNSHNLFFPKNLTTKIKNNKINAEIEKQTSISYNYSFIHDLKLSNSQETAFNQISSSKNNKNLLYWLTWSWKTEIYIKLIKKFLNEWKQSLLLIPEIILSNQISTKIKKVFWESVIIINSTITDATKTKYWLDINNNNARIIIWTRSALFYPYTNLWLIIIDEEHDNSYVSDSSPRYNSIEVANKITELNWNKLLLASWTPSIISMHKALKWDYDLINLLEVYNKKNNE